MNEINKVQLEQISGKDYPITNQISAGRNAKSYLNPTYKLPKFSGYAIRCWGYRGSNISHPNYQSLHPAVSIRQHITKKPSEIVYLNLRKASVIRVMAILPNSRPSTGWRRGDLTNNCIKEISMSAKLRYSRTATIKL